MWVSLSLQSRGNIVGAFVFVSELEKAKCCELKVSKNHVIQAWVCFTVEGNKRRVLDWGGQREEFDNGMVMEDKDTA